MGMFPLLVIFSLVMARPFTAYDSRMKKGSYVVIENEFLAKLLIDFEGVLTKKKVKKCDRNKLNTIGLSFYIANFLIILIAIVMAAMPVIPCTPYEIDTEKLYLYLDTLNEKIPCCLVLILMGIEFMSCSSIIFNFAKEMDEHKWLKILIYVVCVVVATTSGALVIELFIELFK